VNSVNYGFGKADFQFTTKTPVAAKAKQKILIKFGFYPIRCYARWLL